MRAKEIKELRQAGKLEEALRIAKEELENAKQETFKVKIENILSSVEMLCKLEGKIFDYDCEKELTRKALMYFHLEDPKRNLSWVYYEYLKQNISSEKFDLFVYWLKETENLELPEDEKMLFEQLCWQIGKMAFVLSKTNPLDVQKRIRLFETIQSFKFPRPTKGYSFLFKALHKALKDSDRYIHFADWWGFENFMPEDFQKEKMPNGKEVMAVAEQAYIAYSKHLLPKQANHDEIIFDREKAEAFLPKLHKIVDDYPQFQYPAYFLAKLLLALGDKENMLSALLPFAKKKQNDFWVWQILGEAFSTDEEKMFACNCKALSCYSPEEMLVSLRQKMAGIFIKRQLFNEAKTEIELLVKARTLHELKIPHEVINWQNEEWYKNAVAQKSNIDFYKQYTGIAESLLFSDVPEETVIVEFVNTDKKMLNFIASETKFGFFKYERFLRDVKPGDTLKVRFQSGTNDGLFKVYTAVKTVDDKFKNHFQKEIEGDIRIPDGKPFGFLNDTFVHPTVVTKRKLTNGMHLKGTALKSYNSYKKQWGWKLL